MENQENARKRSRVAIEAAIREANAISAGRNKWVCMGCGRKWPFGTKCKLVACKHAGMDGVDWVMVSTEPANNVAKTS